MKGFPAKLALRVAAVAFCALVVAGGLFTWRLLSGGPVSIGLLAPRLEAMINAGLKGIQLRFHDSIIEWSEGRKFAHLQFVDVEVLNESGHVIARVPRTNVTLSGPALLEGTVAPTRVELVGAKANVVRRADGGFQLGFQFEGQRPSDQESEAASEGVTQAVLDAMLNPKPDDTLSKYLTRFAIVDADLTVFDQSTRSNWSAKGASLAFERKAKGINVSLSAPLKLADKSIWLFSGSAKYTNGQSDIALQAAFKPVKLKTLAASGSGMKAFTGLDISVQGNADCNLKTSGHVGRCRFWLNAGSGQLQLPALKKDPIHVKEAALTVELDFEQGRYSINELTWQGKTIRGKVAGEGAFAFDAEGALSTLTADWTAENISIDAPNLFEGGLAIETAKLRADFNAAQGALNIEQIFAKKGGFELNLTGALQDHPVSSGVLLKGSLKDLRIGDLKKLWPAIAAPGARDWVIANVHEGLIKTGAIDVNILPGALEGERIPDEMVSVTFDIAGMKVTYLAGLPDLTGVSGRAIVRGDTFIAEMDAGRVGAIALSSGSVTINETHRTGAVGVVAGILNGPTKEMLTVLDMPRLGYPSRYGISANGAGGTAQVNFQFAVPMLRNLRAEDVGITVNAALKKVVMPINKQFSITGGEFNVDLDAKHMKASGAVQINSAPVGFTWIEDFTGTAKHGTRIDVTATFDPGQRAGLGMNLDPYLQGRTALIATMTGASGKIQQASLEANLTRARLAVPELNWAKPEDANAVLKARFAFRNDKSVEISDIDAVGQGMKVVGRVVLLDGKLQEAQFKKLMLGQRNDFVLDYKSTAASGTKIEVKGKAIDIGGVFDQSGGEDAGGKGSSKSSPLVVKGQVELGYMQADVWYTGLKFSYANDGRNLTQFSIDGVADGTILHGDLSTSGDGSRKLRVETGDAGRLLRGLTGFRSLLGGDLNLSVSLAPLPLGANSAPAAFDGVLRVDNFKIVDQPFFARLLSAGSFTGLDDLMRGEGIAFTRLEQVVQGRGDVITLSDGRAAGPSIGLTAQGTVNRATDRIEIHGTIVPLYGLNSIFEDVPVIGDILGSRNGEGIFGVTYGIKGPLDELKVAVNPISMLAPGFLRKIFQMGSTPQSAAPMPLPMPQAKPQGQSGFQPVPKSN